MEKPHVLIIVDKPGWILARHAAEIKSRLSDFYTFKVIDSRRQMFQHKFDKYDIIYMMDAYHKEVDIFKLYRSRTLIGIRGEFYYSSQLKNYFKTFITSRAKYVHVVNKSQFAQFSALGGEHLFYMPHGINISIFNSKKCPSRRKIFTIGSGGAHYSGGSKGLDDVASVVNDLGLCCHLATGRISWKKMPRYYRKLDAYVCYSKEEGQNNGIMEAGAMGVPIITTNTGAVPEMIKHMKTGYIIDRNLKKLKEAIVWIGSHPEEALRMAQRFQKEIREKWSWEFRINAFKSMFDKIIEIN